MLLFLLQSFQPNLNLLILHQFSKTNQGIKKITLDLQVSYLSSPKFLKKYYVNNFQRILKRYFQNFNVVFAEGFSTQHCLLLMLEKLKNVVDKK